MSKVHRFGSQLGWQKHNLRWLSAFPAQAKQVELLFGFRGTGPQKGHHEWAEGWVGQTGTDKDTGAGWQVWMSRATHMSSQKTTLNRSQRKTFVKENQNKSKTKVNVLYVCWVRNDKYTDMMTW